MKRHHYSIARFHKVFSFVSIEYARSASTTTSACRGARHILQQTVEPDPSHASAHVLPGKNHAPDGNRSAANRELEMALWLEPNDRTPAYQLVLAYTQTGARTWPPEGRSAFRD